MRISLQRHYRFEAAHFLPAVPDGHKCKRMHGHTYAITVAIEGEIDPATGWLIDFADIDERVGPIIRQLDHQLLNDITGLNNPTCELLAVWIWRRVVDLLPQLSEVAVSETPTSRCAYRGA